MTDLRQAKPVADGDKVICPACCHEFRAIPTTVQTLMLNAGFEPPFTAPPAAQPEQRKPLTDEQIMDLCAKQWASHPIEVARAIEQAHNIKEQP